MGREAKCSAQCQKQSSVGTLQLEPMTGDSAAIFV
jgi:hypothetical protein